jgi:phosphate-selective porin OprO/OprP
MFKDDVGASTGAFFGDGQWGWQGRLTALPLWDCDGRTYMHVGLSGGWRNGVSNDAVSPLRTFQLRARPELRDDTPAGFGPANIPNANSNRMVDTGVIAARQDYLMGLEFLYVRGPLSVQAEYGWSFLNHAIGVAPAGLVLNPAIFPPHNYAFEGGYVQLAYTLTGESRAYDKKGGTLNREYFGKRGPFTNAWFVRDEDGHLNWGLGAWEVAARYSYVDLNDGSSKTNLIRGGRMSGVTVGLNWYLNNNISWSFDYVVDRRFDVPFGTIPGWVSGFGTRVQLSF